MARWRLTKIHLTISTLIQIEIKLITINLELETETVSCNASKTLTKSNVENHF